MNKRRLLKIFLYICRRIIFSAYLMKYSYFLSFSYAYRVRLFPQATKGAFY